MGYMENNPVMLKEALEKARSQLYVFYELTKAMRMSLRLEEITYAILTCLTAHKGLGFNRAALFLVNEENKTLNGFMGLGPIDAAEAQETWGHIQKEKKDVYALIDTYQQIKAKDFQSKFMQLIKSLTFGLVKESGLIYETLYQKDTLCIRNSTRDKLAADPLIKALGLKEFLIRSVWIKNKPSGIVVVDNFITQKPITDEDFEIFTMFVEQAASALENSQAFENTLLQAHTDHLTSLWNYGYFQYRLDEEILKASSAKMALSVMMIDLDDFKKFNDAFGHLTGDSALKEIGRILKENCRKIDVLCRYGGEEFSLILPNNNKEEAAPLAERMRKAIEKEEILKSKFTVSIGIASFPQDASDKTTLLKKADAALYRAKDKGKNCVVLA